MPSTHSREATNGTSGIADERPRLVRLASLLDDWQLDAEAAHLAYTTGTYLVKGTDAERSPTRGHGKYVTIWRKRGGWKVAVDIGNGAPPPERDFGPPPPP